MWRDIVSIRLRPDEGEVWKPLALKMQQNIFRGKLVTFDGIDGSGKTTLLNQISQYLTSIGQEYIITKTPSDDVRNMHLWRAWHDESLSIDRSLIHDYALTVIALGDRLLNQRITVETNLREGIWVLVDRYIFSSLAFESGIVHQTLGELLIQPDLSFLIDVEPSIAMKRVRAREYENEHPDDERVARLTRERLLQLMEINKNKAIINTDSSSIEETFLASKYYIDLLIEGSGRGPVA
jgi:dTMP kinase